MPVKKRSSGSFLSVIHTSFTKRISVFIAIYVLLLILCFGVLSFFLTKMNAVSEYTNIMRGTGELASGVLDDHIKDLGSQLGAVAESDELKDLISGLNADENTADISAVDGYPEVEEALDMICRGNSGILSAWVVSDQGGALVGSGGMILGNGEFDLGSQSWYTKYISNVSAQREFICTAPENSYFIPDETVIKIILPVRSSDGNAYAFCGLEAAPDEIFRVLSEYTFADNCYPVVSVDGYAVYSPDGSDIREAPLVNIISRRDTLTEDVDSFVSEEGDTVYYYQTTGQVSGWNMIVVFNNSERSDNIFRTCAQMIMILFCLCALLMIAVVNLLHKESLPLHEIRNCTEEIVRGNCNYRVASRSKNELGTIGENINKIAEILQSGNNIISNYQYTDTLTGLENRSRLYERLEDIIQTREEGRSRFAVMFVDIDNFKWLNETLGHNFGDAVLCSFADIMKEQLPSELSIFRFSGDEFIILKEFDTDYSEVNAIIEKLHNCFNKPLEILNDKIYIKFSIGISIYPNDDLTPDLLLRDAEMALHRAKENGKDRVAFYTNASRKNSLLSKAAIARSLNEALEKGELSLHYQPIISADTCDIHGFEVLLRWISPEFGVVSPTEFINVAEESGAIVQIGTWIFESACRTLTKINETLNPNVIMSINVSPVQLRRDDYIDHVKRVIEITHVDPKNIQLEITESTLIDFTDSKSSVINEINELGIALALDDFGTGYSSLNYLKNFPIKCLKIDKSFIDEINNNQRDYAITDSIIDLVHNLGIKTVAEGIETVGQYKFLAKMKCDYIQGFLMSKPLEEADAIEFVEKYDALHKPDQHKLEENERQLADEKKRRLKEKEETSQSSGDGESPTEDFIISK